ncbi:major facilitator superfamily domain-containing protein [Boeremia exigua]|uniref:major facilitator superfamily domain-containing protein n=1 Tax=Boeremia exigua TaxID=749465 RepID=UPI001E8D4025|nr:major facilitator superfamily domain-containing protein [Boeremia exigua]KAH6618753.1 major facilitator superfamily domain-containing protein [Boeremia exigua]
MGLFTDLTLAKSKTKEEVTPVEPFSNVTIDAEKDAGSATPSEKAKEEGPFTANAQAGVKRVEAATTVWTKWHLIGAYAIIWWIYFVTALQEVVTRALNPYVVSAFKLHSLTAATGIVSSIVGGLFKIPLAKLLDTWGRPQGLLISLLMWIVGYIMMAGCNNVETYAAAKVFSSTGSQAVSYILTVFIADTSSLKNRALMLSFATSPYIITTWIGGPVAESTLDGPGWRWGFGIFAIVIPVVVIPLAVLVLFNDRKAKKMGLLDETKVKWTPANIKKFCVDIDLVGILILTAGMALFLLPFSLWSYQGEQWKSPMIICMLVFGFVLLLIFPIWEKYFAPVTFIPYELLLDRTVFMAGMMFVFNYFNSAVWGSYFSSMLQVVWNLSVTEASYVTQVFRVVQCGWCFFVLGPLIRYTGRFKWTLTYFALPLDILAIGLMIHFRQPGTSIGYIVMTQIFTAVAGGTIVIGGELAMMAPSDHQHIAVILAILNLFCSIGSAAGSSVSGAIWTGTFRKNLIKYVPAGVNVDAIYAALPKQLSYAWGSPERMGIARAYGDSQRLMLITSICMLSLALICSVFIRDINIKHSKQVIGRVA